MLHQIYGDIAGQKTWWCDILGEGFHDFSQLQGKLH
jgi:hypothetical protein